MYSPITKHYSKNTSKSTKQLVCNWYFLSCSYWKLSNCCTLITSTIWIFLLEECWRPRMASLENFFGWFWLISLEDWEMEIDFGLRMNKMGKYSTIFLVGVVPDACRSDEAEWRFFTKWERSIIAQLMLWGFNKT